jgi:hypothetical protein
LHEPDLAGPPVEVGALELGQSPEILRTLAEFGGRSPARNTVCAASVMIARSRFWMVESPAVAFSSAWISSAVKFQGVVSADRLIDGLF